MVYAAIIGAAASIYGSVAQSRADRKAASAQKKNTARALSLLDAGETSASAYLRNALSLLEQAPQQAMAQTANAEFEARRSLRNAYLGRDAGATQNLASRGLYSSSLADAYRKGALGAYAQDAGQIGAQFSGLRSQILMQGAQGQAQGLSNLASLASNTAGQRASIVGNIQYQAPQGIAASYGALGAAVGSALDGWSQWASKRRPSPVAQTSQESAR